MAQAALQNHRTFLLKTPADLYRKLHFEALALRNQPPADLTERCYAVMNAVTTAWQLKDWGFHALASEGRLADLHRFASRTIKHNGEFGVFLCDNSPWMAMCFQLATAAKHFEVSMQAGPEVRTKVDFQFDSGDVVPDLTGRQELIVQTVNQMISGPDLVLLLDYIWGHALRDLGLLADDTE